MTFLTQGIDKVDRFFIGGWFSWAVIHALLLLSFDFSVEISCVDSMVSNSFLFGACLVVRNNLKYYRPDDNKFFYLFVICFMLSGICMGFSSWILSEWFSGDAVYLWFVDKSTWLRYCVYFLMLELVSMFSIMWYNQEDQKAGEKRQFQAEKLAREAELFKLRQQLQPHFLFNSLNSISALIGTKPEEARKMLYQLSDFLRGTLKEEKEWISLADELLHLQLYLDIEKVRFGHRLSVNIDMGEDTRALKLPPLLLQPIVENAIKFGLYDTTEQVGILIKTETMGKELVVVIQNPFDPETSQPRRGTGFGLRGVKRRLYLLFARNDLVETEASQNIFTTIIRIPQI